MPTLTLTLGAFAGWIHSIFGVPLLDPNPWPETPLDCLDEGPVLSRSIAATSNVSIEGEWRIPLSFHRPEILTEARVRISYRPRTEFAAPTIDALIHFPDPKPYGLPFTFQGLAIETREVGSTQVERLSLDWTQNCEGPGRSLFPGGAWTETLPVRSDMGPLEEMRVILWGSRN